MLDQTSELLQRATEILGDPTALAAQLGGPEGLTQLTVPAASLGPAGVDTVTALSRFLGSYASAVLVPHELPAVAQAYLHAERGQVRELVELDRQLSQEQVLTAMAQASRYVGRAQLRRLRPLRGTRLVHRYLDAVERGQANGWHTVVFGVVLALYSLPLRQGLVHFGHQTLGGFVESASQRLQIDLADRQRLIALHSDLIRTAAAKVIAQHAPSLLPG